MKKKASPDLEDDLRPEYDFGALRLVARGPGRKRPAELTVHLAPDVAEMFPDSEAVNEALRFLVRITRKELAPQSGTERLEEMERRSRISSALGLLSAEQRHCIELAFFEGLTHTQIAERLQAPLRTVKSRFLLGMNKLRQALRA